MSFSLQRMPRALALGITIGIAASGQGQVKTWHNIGEFGGPMLWVVGLGSSLVQDEAKVSIIRLARWTA